MIEVIRNIIDEQIADFGLAELKLGTVVKVNPLEIKISDRIVLSEKQLLLTEQVLEKKIKLEHTHSIDEAVVSSSSHSHSVSGNTASAGDDAHTHGVDIQTSSSSHSHSISGGTSKQLHGECIIQEGLMVSDKVIMMSVEKNQKFVVLSKVRDKKSVLIDGITSRWEWS